MQHVLRVVTQWPPNSALAIALVSSPVDEGCGFVSLRFGPNLDISNSKFVEK